MTANFKLIKIFIVDDHQMFIDGLKALLKNINNISVVAEALNGKQAVEILHKEKIGNYSAGVKLAKFTNVSKTF